MENSQNPSVDRTLWLLWLCCCSIVRMDRIHSALSILVSWSNLKFESLPFLISNHLSFQKLDMNVWLRDCIVRATEDALTKLFRNRVPFAHIHPDAGTARGGKNPAQRILLTFSLRKKTAFFPFVRVPIYFFSVFGATILFATFTPQQTHSGEEKRRKAIFVMTCRFCFLVAPFGSFTARLASCFMDEIQATVSSIFFWEIVFYFVSWECSAFTQVEIILIQWSEAMWRNTVMSHPRRWKINFSSSISYLFDSINIFILFSK